MHRVTPKRAALILVGLMIMMVAMADSCESQSSPEQQRQKAIESRAHTFARAEAAVPIPQTTNFPLRKALAEMTARQDLVNHPWYIYILGQNGNTIGYYVGKTVPINACDFLSSTQEVTNGTGSNTGDSNVIVAAPSLDGIYYGGSGASGGCDAWVFFDQTTNALIQIRGVDFFTSDRPLNLDAQAIKVAS